MFYCAREEANFVSANISRWSRDQSLLSASPYRKPFPADFWLPWGPISSHIRPSIRGRGANEQNVRQSLSPVLWHNHLPNKNWPKLNILWTNYTKNPPLPNICIQNYISIAPGRRNCIAKVVLRSSKVHWKYKYPNIQTLHYFAWLPLRGGGGSPHGHALFCNSLGFWQRKSGPSLE